MGLPTSSTYDLATPRRAGINDILLATKANAPGKPGPNPNYGPDASEFNMLAWLLAALNRTAPLVRLVITEAAGAYVIAECKALGAGVTTASFTLTKNGTGDVTISWAASTVLPGTSLQPGVVQVNDTVPRIWTAYATTAAVPAANSPAVRIVIQDNAGAAADAPFTLELT